MKALSLFSGIGGIDLAAEWAGIEAVAFCEREPFCQKVLAKHWPSIPIYDDVCTLTKERLEQDGIGTIELIHGGYPCQPFSLAGDRKGSNDDRHLWPEVLRLIKSIRPRWFVGENVAGHVTLGLDDVLSDLGSVGYTWQPFVIPASAVYAQHRRERVFIVAYSGKERLQAEGPEQQTTGITGESQVVPNTESKQDRRLQFGRLEPNIRANSEKHNVAHTNSKSESQTGPSFSTIRSEWNTWDDVVRSRGGIQSGTDWWATEPNVGRVANGIPNRVDRLKALGNAVVPQQIYPILAAIKQIDDMMQAS